MGYFRCLSKSTKRFFFAYADKVSQKWMKNTYEKYTLKYINKINKLNDCDVVKSFYINQYHTIPGLLLFKNNLENDLIEESGLAHSKVREYWLRRGPRLLFVLIFIIVLTFLLGKYLTNVSYDEQIYSIIIGINMILYNTYMLYQRLIDSISSAMMRIGHDHYTKWKSEKIYNCIKITKL